METRKVTVILYPDEDGGFTAILPYFSCTLISGNGCLTAQGWTAEEALEEARVVLQEFLDRNGEEGRYHLEHARLERVEVRELELDAA